jgi:FkbM family methyltransferase
MAEVLAKYYLENRAEFVGEAGHEKLLTCLKQLVQKEPNTIGIDVGSCIGKYIHNIQDICGDGAQIFCFEPNPVNIAELEPNLPVNCNLFKHCLSHETVSAALYNWKGRQDNKAGNGIAGLRGGGAKLCDVEVKRLDDVLDTEFGNKVPAIQFMKIDTEGNDGNVLKGLRRHLNKTKYIIFECSDCLDDIRGPGIPGPMKDIVDFLSAEGFDTYRIGTKKLLKVNDEFWSQTYEDVKFWSNCFALPWST